MCFVDFLADAPLCSLQAVTDRVPLCCSDLSVFALNVDLCLCAESQKAAVQLIICALALMPPHSSLTCLTTVADPHRVRLQRGIAVGPPSAFSWQPSEHHCTACVSALWMPEAAPPLRRRFACW